MKYLIIIVLVIGLLGGAFVLSSCAEKKEQPMSGKPSPSNTMANMPEHSSQPSAVKAANFTLTSLDGKPVSLSDYAGKVVILDFWATWCPPCRNEIPHFNELAAEYGDKGLVVLGVSVDRDGVDVVKKFRDSFPVKYPVVMGDQGTSQQYQTYLPPDQRGGIPFTFIVDKEGNIREKYVGYRPKEVFETAIKNLL